MEDIGAMAPQKASHAGVLVVTEFTVDVKSAILVN